LSSPSSRFPDPNRDLTGTQFVDPAQPLKHTEPPAPPQPEIREEKQGATLEGAQVNNVIKQEEATEVGLKTGVEGGALKAQVRAVDGKREAQLGVDRLEREGEGVRQEKLPARKLAEELKDLENRES
jgi:hypothetical protein